MKTVDIKGKPYVEVSERIKFFRTEFEDGQIITTMMASPDPDKLCIFKCEVFVNGKLKATGHAYEEKGSSFINKTSYIENCETSAVGRALGILGIGVDASVASADEVANAIKQQNEPPKLISKDQAMELESRVADTDSDVSAFLKFAGAETFEEIQLSALNKCRSALAAKEKK